MEDRKLQTSTSLNYESWYNLMFAYYLNFYIKAYENTQSQVLIKNENQTAKSSPEAIESAKIDLNCSICDLFFKSNKGLKQHIGKIHNLKSKKSKCKICGKFYKHKYAVLFHVNQVHQKSTMIDCKVCGKSIYNKYKLAKHMEISHERFERRN